MLAVDGLMSMSLLVPLALADLDEAVDTWDAHRAEAHRQGRCSGSRASSSGARLYPIPARRRQRPRVLELRASRETLRLWGMPTESSARTPSPFLAEVLVERGAVDEARVLLDNAGSARVGFDQAILLDRARMRVPLAAGSPKRRSRTPTCTSSTLGEDTRATFCGGRLKAQALERLGRHVEAVALAEDELEIARGWGSPGTVGRSLRVLGTILRADGDRAARGGLCPARAGAGTARAREGARRAFGATLRRARKPTEAREPLRRALELVDMCGARPLADAVRAEIYATGARPRTTALRGAGALIMSERRVADLAAGGQTNRDRADPVRDAQDGRGAPATRTASWASPRGASSRAPRWSSSRGSTR